MEGGIHAWNGLEAAGIPDAGMVYFRTSADTAELTALAWILEDGSMRFYADIAQSSRDQEARRLFDELAVAEEHHKASLEQLHQEHSGGRAEEDFPASILTDVPGDIMEGGMSRREALAWTVGKQVSAILELALSLETNSYDLYIKMARKMKDNKAQEIFALLAADEKKHLEKLALLLEKKI
jgi:rubrerythrin